MIERVARAVEQELGRQEAVLTDPLTLRRMQAKRIARAAITAMREPTEEMTFRAAVATKEFTRDDEGRRVTHYLAPDRLNAGYAAMIEAAIADVAIWPRLRSPQTAPPRPAG